jgi:hypothetical protein
LARNERCRPDSDLLIFAVCLLPDQRIPYMRQAPDLIRLAVQGFDPLVWKEIRYENH